MVGLILDTAGILIMSPNARNSGEKLIRSKYENMIKLNISLAFLSIQFYPKTIVFLHHNPQLSAWGATALSQLAAPVGLHP